MSTSERDLSAESSFSDIFNIALGLWGLDKGPKYFGPAEDHSLYITPYIKEESLRHLHYRSPRLTCKMDFLLNETGQVERLKKGYLHIWPAPQPGDKSKYLLRYEEVEDHEGELVRLINVGASNVKADDYTFAMEDGRQEIITQLIDNGYPEIIDYSKTAKMILVGAIFNNLHTLKNVLVEGTI